MQIWTINKLFLKHKFNLSSNKYYMKIILNIFDKFLEGHIWVRSSFLIKVWDCAYECDVTHYLY